MSSFRVLVGRFAIVGTTGAARGSQPAEKSDALAFDVIDRMNRHAAQYVRRDQTFDAAFDFCTRSLALLAVPRSH